MKYRLREGLVIETVCGKPLLAATLKARKYCPYLTELNESSLFVLKMIEKELDIDEMAKKVSAYYQIDEETAAASLSAYLETLQSSGFILPLKDEKGKL